MSDFINSIEKISQLESTIYEEDSWAFLSQMQLSDWYVYDSDQIGLITTKMLADTFAAFHGKISFPKDMQNAQNIDGFWSSVPLGVFRYKMLSDGSPYLVDTVKKVPGYIVEGIYWINGFIYLVRDDKEIFQLKLFIDRHTKLLQMYPDIMSL